MRCPWLAAPGIAASLSGFFRREDPWTLVAPNKGERNWLHKAALTSRFGRRLSTGEAVVNQDHSGISKKLEDGGYMCPLRP
jgi:hypothetical protein